MLGKGTRASQTASWPSAASPTISNPSRSKRALKAWPAVVHGPEEQADPAVTPSLWPRRRASCSTISTLERSRDRGGEGRLPPLRIPGFPRIEFRDFPPANARIQWIVLLPPDAYAPRRDAGEPPDRGDSSDVQRGGDESEVRRHEEPVTAVVDSTGVSARGDVADAPEAGEHIACREGARRPPGHRPAGAHPVQGGQRD